jgi:molybdate transport system regulatory protein
MAPSHPDLSTRNQLAGTVTGVTLGTVMADVAVDVQGQEIGAVISRHSAERLALAEGESVTVLIKATEVMLSKGTQTYDRITTRNQIQGTIDAVSLGSVMAEVTVSVAGGDMVAAVTRKSADRLQLAAGDEVVVLTKATEVMLAK